MVQHWHTVYLQIIRFKKTKYAGLQASYLAATSIALNNFPSEKPTLGNACQTLVQMKDMSIAIEDASVNWEIKWTNLSFFCFH